MYIYIYIYILAIRRIGQFMGSVHASYSKINDVATGKFTCTCNNYYILQWWLRRWAWVGETKRGCGSECKSTPLKRAHACMHVVLSCSVVMSSRVLLASVHSGTMHACSLLTCCSFRLSSLSLLAVCLYIYCRSDANIYAYRPVVISIYIYMHDAN